MVRHIHKRLMAGLMAFALLLSSVLMPAQAAFATAPVGDVPLLEQEFQALVEEEEQVEVLTEEVERIDKEHKATLCHATNSATNPYVEITVDYNAFTKQGHDIHDGPVAMTVAMAQQLKAEKIDWGDIIPAVPQWDYAGKNVPAGQTILDNGCAVPEGEPELVVLPELKAVDPCGLENAYLDTAPLDGIVGLTYDVLLDGSVKVVAEDGFLLTLNGNTTFKTYVYDPAKDSGKLCKVKAVMPEFKDRCGTSKDFFRVKATEYVDYYWGDTKLKPGKKYKITDASKVIIKAVSSDEDYKIVGKKKFKYQFTDELCKPKAKLQVAAECVGLDTRLTTMLKNPTNSMQYYEVVVTNAGGTELATKQVDLGAKATGYPEFEDFVGDGSFKVWVYSFNDKQRGKLLAKQVVETECEDTFTPEIYKVDQDMQVLPDGVFTVEVCQDYEYRANVLSDQEEDGCETYVGVNFGTDGNWFAENVEYKPFVPTTVTITEVTPPQGCKAAGPWVFEWQYIQKEDDIFAVSRYDGEQQYREGAWNVGSNVFYLENDCTTPVEPEPEPEPTVQVLSASSDEPMLAETGDPRTALLTLAVVMMLGGVGFAVSPLLRRNEA